MPFNYNDSRENPLRASLLARGYMDVTSIGNSHNPASDTLIHSFGEGKKKRYNVIKADKKKKTQ